MILRDVVVYSSPGRKDVFISDGRIKRIAEAGQELNTGKDETVYNLNGAVAFPGFINSHDHLDFNNYPQLGGGKYKNYTEWGHDIHKRFAHEIEAVKKIPQALRIQWGLYKNLLNGFTTVVNHGEKINAGNELVNVFQNCYSLHSVAFEKNWWRKLNHPFRNSRPYVMHLGEGTDEQSLLEIKKVVKANIFGKNIVAVHGVAMNYQNAQSFSALVWCPASNMFLFGETAAVDELKEKTNIVFGTDSTLTSSWRIKEHLQIAMESGLVTKNELAEMLTVTPARIWKLTDRGVIDENKAADIVITSSDDLATAEIVAVIKNGELKLVDKRIAENSNLLLTENYSRIRLGQQYLYIKGNLPALVSEIVKYYPAVEIPFEIV